MSSLQEIIKLSSNMEGETLSQDNRQQLITLTQYLIQDYLGRGELVNHPYAEILKRKTPIADKVDDYLSGKRVLVTGAAGCIGRSLCHEIVGRSPKSIVAFDKDSIGLKALKSELPTIETRCGDLCDEEGLRRLWSEVRPQVVFHLAAEREPGRAEKTVRNTVLTNVIGTRNICQIASVMGMGCERIIHASTGKCRLIYEERIYPATKQLAEFELRRHACINPQIKWACVRFHHVVDNSIAERTFKEQIALNKPVTVHLPPERSQHGQNAQEATALMLNAGLYAEDAQIFGSRRQTDYFSVLNLALYLINKSGKKVPLFFTKPDRRQGYMYEEFPGARRPPEDDSERRTHSFNSIETDLSALRQKKELDLVWSEFPRLDMGVTKQALDQVIGEAVRTDSSKKLRPIVYQKLLQIASTVYAHAPSNRLGDALRFGVKQSWLQNMAALSRFQLNLELLLNSIMIQSHQLDYNARRKLREPLKLLISSQSPTIAKQAKEVLAKLEEK